MPCDIIFATVGRGGLEETNLGAGTSTSSASSRGDSAMGRSGALIGFCILTTSLLSAPGGLAVTGRGCLPFFFFSSSSFLRASAASWASLWRSSLIRASSLPGTRSSRLRPSAMAALGALAFGALGALALATSGCSWFWKMNSIDINCIYLQKQNNFLNLFQ